MSKQLLEQDEKFELKGVEVQVVSVGSHEVDGEQAGFSYVLRSTEDINNDAEVARQAEEAAKQRAKDEEAERVKAREEAESKDNQTEGEE